MILIAIFFYAVQKEVNSIRLDESLTAALI